MNPTFAFEPSIQLVLEQVNVDILCHPGAVVTVKGGVGGTNFVTRSFALNVDNSWLEFWDTLSLS